MFKSALCDLCTEAEKHMRAWESTHPGEIVVLRCNAALKEYKIGDYSPGSVPSYALTENGTVLKTVDGKALDVAGIDKLLQ